MIRQPPSSTRSATRFPYPTLFRSAVDATLPARAHPARQTAPRRLLQIGISEHQHRRLAAEFTAAGFQGVGGTAQHFLRRCAAAAALALIDARISYHRLANVAVPAPPVIHASRNTPSPDQPGEPTRSA